MAETATAEGASSAPTLRRGRLRLRPTTRRRPTRRRAIAGGALGAALLCGAGLLTSLHSPLAISAVEVVGANPELQPAVVSALGAQAGQAFSSVDAREAEAMINGIDGVADVHLDWTWWNTLTVRVQEQTAVGVIAAADGTFTVIDPSGAAIRTVSARPAGLPLVDSPGGAAAHAAALRVLKELEPGALGGLDAVVAAGTRAVELHLVSGTRVIIGPSVDLAEKILVAQQLSPTGAKVIDVTVPERPALSGLPKAS